MAMVNTIGHAQIDGFGEGHIQILNGIIEQLNDVLAAMGELARILGHIDKMRELATSAVPPTAHVLDVVNVTRPDKPRPSLSREDALRNAPAVAHDSFRVPRMS